MPLYDSATLYDSAVVTYDGRNSWDTSPAISIYLAFDGTPYEVAPVWTDVTGYVSQVDTDRSRSDDFSAFVSTATVVFRNETQLFSPFNTSGTFYGKLKPRLQIKIEATVLGNIYPVFRGFCAGFPVSNTEAGYASTVTVQCFDALALLATELVSDYVYAYTKSLSPTNYWRGNDGQSSTIITDDVAGLNAEPVVVGSNYRVGTPMSSALASKNALCPPAGYANTPVTFKTQTANQITWAGWFQLINTGTTANCILYFASIDKYIQINVSPPNGYAQVAISDLPVVLGTVGLRSTDLGYSYNTTPFFFTITWIKATKVSAFYINGVLQVGTLLVGANCAVDTGPVSKVEYIGVGIQEHSVYTTAFTAAQVVELYNYNINNILETSSARFSRLMAMTPFSTSLTTISTTPVVTVGEMPAPNTSLVQALTRTVDSEGGFMYVDRAGSICFRDRNYIYTNTTCNTSQATFSTASIRFEPQVTMDLTDDNVRNDITVTFSGGGTTNRTNDASIAAYGTNALSLDTDLSTIQQAKDLGGYTAAVAGNLTADLSPVQVNTTGSETDWATLLALDLLDRTTITIAPQQGSSFTKVQLLNSIQHHITPSEWEMTIDGSSQYTAFFILNKSSLDGSDLLI